MKKIIVVLILFFANLMQAQQLTIKEIEQKLEALSLEQSGLNEKVESEVTGLNLYSFLSSLALEYKLNVDVDPRLNTIVESNYFDVPVKEVLLFLIKQHNIDVEFVNQFVVFKKRKEEEKTPIKKVEKPIDIKYRIENEFLSVNLRNDSLPSVAEKITKESGRNVIVSPAVKNVKVTGYFQNRPFDDIMNMIGQSNGLLVIKNENGSYFIQKDETPKEVKTDVVNSSQSSNRRRKGRQSGASIADSQGFYEVTTSDSGFLNINAREADVTGVIMEAAEKLKLNYYMYSLPTDIETTLVATEISFDDLLNIVFRGKDYTYNQDASGFYFIGNRSEEGLRSTELIQLENRTIETVMNSIPTELKTDLEIKEFPELNGLIVSGSKPKIEELRLYLYQIDKVVPMVQLEVFIVQYNKSHDIQTGMKAGLDPNGADRVTSGILFPTTDVSLNAESVNGLIDIFNGFGIFNLGKVTEQFYANLQFLENNSVIKLESTPKIATLSGHEATLTIGETSYYFEQNNSIFNTGINNTITQSGTWKPTEANLSVTIKPFVSKDEQITLKLRVEKNSFLGRAGENAPPGKATQSFDSEIRVKNNEMTLLGGLDELTRENSGTGVPFLARIPVIKWFFSGRAKKKSKSKLHILIKTNGNILMISSLKNKLLKHTTIVVVGIYFETESVTYTIVKVSQKNNKLLISNQASYKSFKELDKALEKKLPVILNFSGKGILNKKTDHIPDYRSKALLNVNKNDFYFYEHIQDKDVFISVIRKEKVLEHISMFNTANLLVIDYSVGPFIAAILSHVSEDEHIIANSTELEVINNSLLNFKITNESKILTIDSQAISEKETALLASAINYFYPIETFQYENDFLNTNKEEANFKNYFEILGVIILGGFFSLLLISYLMLGHYNDKIVSINSNIKSVQETYDIIKDLQNDRDNKKEILNESGVFTSQFLAFYINELTIDIPKSITLNTFSLFPYDRKIKPLEKIKFEENSIILKGESSSNIIFNDWYKGLKKIDWISKSDIINYQANRNNNYDFEIKLKIR